MQNKNKNTSLVIGIILIAMLNILVIWGHLKYLEYNSKGAKIQRNNQKIEKAIWEISQNNHFLEKNISLKNIEIQALEKSIQIKKAEIEKNKNEKKRNILCIALNRKKLGTLEHTVNCNTIPTVRLEPDELFYTYAKKDKPSVSQTEHSHYSSARRGAMIATDVSNWPWEADTLYVPDYRNEVKKYTITNHTDQPRPWFPKWYLWDFVKLSWKEWDHDMRWIIGHTTSNYQDGDTVYTGQVLGKTNLTGATSWHHSHIELWDNGKNVPYSKRSKELLLERGLLPKWYNTSKRGNESRKSQETTQKTANPKQEVSQKATSFFYTSVPWDGNLPPNSYLYKEVGEKYGIDWRMISAIHCTETFDIKRKKCTRSSKGSISSANAQGCMQFIPSTWKIYGTDGNGDGVKDITNCRDSIYSAGNYLATMYKIGKKKWYTDREARRYAYKYYNNASWYINRAENIFNSLQNAENKPKNRVYRVWNSKQNRQKVWNKQNTFSNSQKL